MGAMDMRQGAILCAFLSMSRAYIIFLASNRRRFASDPSLSAPIFDLVTTYAAALNGWCIAVPFAEFTIHDIDCGRAYSLHQERLYFERAIDKGFWPTARPS